MEIKKFLKNLDTHNVSINCPVTKQRFESFWGNASNEQKNEAVKLAQYSDTRSFTNAKNKGQMSVRMILSLAITFDKNPFWISAEENIEDVCSIEKVDAFLKKNNFEEYCSRNLNVPKQLMKDLISDISSDIPDDFEEQIEKITPEEYLKILDVLFIKSKISKSSKEMTKLDLIKYILISK